MTYYIPAYVGATIPEDMSFEARVNWYALWIREHWASNIHFKIPHLGPNAGFISERRTP